MIYEKTWQFDMNRAYVPTAAVTSIAQDLCKYTLWYYKAFLTGGIGGATQGLWTVAGSSDSVTAGMDAVDRWTTTYTNGKINKGTGAHSWIVLQSPVILGKTYYLLLDYNTATDYYIAISLSTSVPTGGSITAAPTMPLAFTQSNEVFAFAAPTGSCTIRLHGQLATDGSFHILLSRDYTGNFCSGFIGTLLSNYKTFDTTPFFVTLGGDSNQGLTTGYGNSSYLWNSANANIRHPDDTLAATGYGIIEPGIGSSGNNPQLNMPLGNSIWDGEWADFPLWVGSNTAGFRTVRGRIQDILINGGYTSLTAQNAPTGAVDNYTTPTAMVVGRYWFPTNVIPIL